MLTFTCARSFWLKVLSHSICWIFLFLYCNPRVPWASYISEMYIIASLVNNSFARRFFCHLFVRPESNIPEYLHMCLPQLPLSHVCSTYPHIQKKTAYRDPNRHLWPHCLDDTCTSIQLILDIHLVNGLRCHQSFCIISSFRVLNFALITFDRSDLVCGAISSASVHFWSHLQLLSLATPSISVMNCLWSFFVHLVYPFFASSFLLLLMLLLLALLYWRS